MVYNNGHFSHCHVSKFGDVEKRGKGKETLFLCIATLYSRLLTFIIQNFVAWGRRKGN